MSDHVYVILSQANAAYAAQVSRAIYQQMVPNQGDRETQYWCGWVTHGRTGQVALVMPITGRASQIRIHPNADASKLTAVFGPAMTATERGKLVADVAGKRGDRVMPVDWLPPSIAANARTPEEFDLPDPMVVTGSGLGNITRQPAGGG